MKQLETVLNAIEIELFDKELVSSSMVLDRRSYWNTISQKKFLDFIRIEEKWKHAPNCVDDDVFDIVWTVPVEENEDNNNDAEFTSPNILEAIQAICAIRNFICYKLLWNLNQNLRKIL